MKERHPGVDWAAIDDVIFAKANPAGEDIRNVARMSLLLAGLPQTVSGTPTTGYAGRAWMRSPPQRALSAAERQT